MTSQKIDAFRSQVSSLVTDIESGDKEAHDRILGLAEVAGPEFEEAVSDLLDKAVEAEEARRKAALEAETEETDEETSANEEKSEEQANRERREKIAKIFSDRNEPEAAQAIEMELEGLDGQTADWVNKAIYSAMKAEVLNGNDANEYKRLSWARAVAWSHCNAARTIAQTASEEKAETLLGYLVNNIASAMRAVEFRRGTPDQVKEKLVQKAKDLLDRVYFPGYVLGAIERLLDKAQDGETNTVSQILRENSRLASEVYSSEKRALALIDGLKQEAEKTIGTIRVGPMRPGKTQADKAKGVTKSQKLAERVAHDKDYRIKMEGHNPSADSFKKGKKRN